MVSSTDSVGQALQTMVFRRVSLLNNEIRVLTLIDELQMEDQNENS